MGSSKDWFPKFGFSRRNDNAFINFVTTSGRKRFLVKETLLTPTEIVGSAVGAIGHANGAILVPAPGANFVLKWLQTLLIFDYAVAAYTGGADDCVIQNGDGAVALSAVIASADLIGASGDKIVSVSPLEVDVALTANKPITLKGTAFTQPGTAAGVVRAHSIYFLIPTKL